MSRNEVKADDLIYYADEHRVAMAVDSVRAVRASAEGVPVKIADIVSIGPIDINRRIECRTPVWWAVPRPPHRQ